VIPAAQPTPGPHHGADLGPVAQALAVAVLVVLAGYLVAAYRPTGRRWSPWRTASFVAGSALVLLALLGPGAGFAGHMWRHLLIGMLGPLGLVLGAPVTLALGVLPPRGGRAVLRVLRTPPLRVLSHPVTALVLSVGALFLLYLTPLYRASTTDPLLHDLIHLHVLLAGVLFTWSVTGPDPAPHRPGVPARLVVLGVSIAAHAALAQLLYAGLHVDVPATVDDRRTGATIMYYGGDLAELLVALSLLVTWRPARPDRTDRSIDMAARTPQARATESAP
jgi:putative membrane protein